MAQNEPDALLNLISYLLMTVGVLVIVAGGLCTLFAISSEGGSFFRNSWISIMIIPILVGLAIFFLGRSLRKPMSRPDSNDPDLRR